MKYKVGDKVKAKGDGYFNKGETVEIIKVDSDSVPYYCEGKHRCAWQCESGLEPLNSHLTFQQKLDRFKREPIGFLVKSKEIADELAKVFEREGMKVHTSNDIRESLLSAVKNSRYYAGIAYVSYGAAPYNGSLSFGTSDFEGELNKYRELLDITLEELKSYNAPQTLEEKLKLFKAETHVLYTPTQEIYEKLMVELEKRGYVWCNGKELPTKYNGYSSGPYVTKFFIYEHNGIARQSKAYDKEVLTLTPGDFSTPQVITIATDGYYRVTAESNGVTAESLCNPTDTFDISKGSHIALKRLLEKLDEDTIEELGDLSGEPEGFNLGDVVEVVRCDFSFADEVKGVQGVITKNNDAAYRVKFPVKFNGDDTWAFYDSELKLVRKYNA